MSKLVSQGVVRTIVSMAVPMLAGTFAMNMYNLTNAWFVARLGTEALAAISFSFPVVMLLMFVTRGLSGGALTLVAHAIGANDRKKAATLTTHALILAALFGALVCGLGLVTVSPLFSRLGASGQVLEMTVRYMNLWYLGAVVMALQIVAADIIISTGNTRAVSCLMVGSTLVNSSALLDSWGKILVFGVPGSLGMVLTPISAAVITRLVAGYGTAAVAAMGVASRIEMFAFMVPMTVGMSLIPFVAQNYGAGRIDRIRSARKGTMWFALLYGVFIGLVFILFAPAMARIFSTDRVVVDVLCSYIYTTCMGYGMLEVHRYAGFIVTGAHYPLQASLLNVIRVLVLLIPLALIGGHLFLLRGIFFARLASDLLAGLIGIWWSGRMLARRAAR